MVSLAITWLLYGDRPCSVFLSLAIIFTPQPQHGAELDKPPTRKILAWDIYRWPDAGSSVQAKMYRTCFRVHYSCGQLRQIQC